MTLTLNIYASNNSVFGENGNAMAIAHKILGTEKQLYAKRNFIDMKIVRGDSSRRAQIELSSTYWTTDDGILEGAGVPCDLVDFVTLTFDGDAYMAGI